MLMQLNTLKRKLPVILSLMFSLWVATVRSADPPAIVRWYSYEQVEQGRGLFIKYCAACHKADASGTQDWKKPLADGNYPPPPLNGSAHSWHHSKSVLKSTIARGGKQWDGVMPAFGGILNDAEQDQIISYFQSYWSDEKYKIWIERDGLDD